MINYNDITEYLLVSELDVLTFSSVTLQLALEITAADSSTVLSCTYTPVDGVVNVYDLDRLLSPMIGGVMADFTFSVNGTTTTIHIVQSKTRVSQESMTFLASHFLSSVMLSRTTVIGRKEMVTFIALEATDVTAACIYADSSNVIQTNTVTLETALAAGSAHEVDVSPGLFENSELGTLVGYDVIAGDRTMSFRVSAIPTARKAMLMRNNFGAWEPCYFLGMNEADPKITRNMVQVGNIQRPLKIDEEDNIKSYTGPLRPGGVQLFRDLARTSDVLLLEDGVATDPIAIIESDIKYNDDDGHLPEFTFTWHRASLRSMMIVYIIPRLFDSTFDATFN